MSHIERLMKFEKDMGMRHDAKRPNIGNWRDGHAAALQWPEGPEEDFLAMLEGWLHYADHHKKRFESRIGEDYFLGPEWAKIGLAIRVLLNGELGRLDGGTLDAVILDTLGAEGFDENGGKI